MMPNRQLQEISVERITVPKGRFRVVTDEEKLSELAESIKGTGQVESISLLPEKNGKYQLITGYRRLQAAMMAKKRSVWAEVLEIDPEEAQLYEAVENLHHVSLTIEEKRNMIGRLWLIAKKRKWTQKELANKIGMPERSLEYELQALDLLKKEDLPRSSNTIDSQTLVRTKKIEPKLRKKFLESVIEGRIPKGGTGAQDATLILGSEKVVPELKEEIVSKKSKIDLDDAKQIAQLRPQDQKTVVEEIKQQGKTFKDIVQDSLDIVKESRKAGMEPRIFEGYKDVVERYLHDYASIIDDLAVLGTEALEHRISERQKERGIEISNKASRYIDKIKEAFENAKT